jgi:hypothetical protein
MTTRKSDGRRRLLRCLRDALMDELAYYLLAVVLALLAAAVFGK